MQTSAKGIAALEAEEGVVLRAYLDVVNVWTIGAGLTAASGVVRPKAGMVITKAQATNLLQLALREKYEPAVETAMARVIRDGTTVVRPKQHEFDAGVSFHWNTGAIRKASWVKIWVNLGKRRGSAPDDVRRSLMQWIKGGGKVLPGLVNRRRREADMLLDGVYPHRIAELTPLPVHAIARWALQPTASERVEAFMAFEALGYQLGVDPWSPWADGIRQFQADHALTVDGIIGRATLSTLQRRLDAPKAAAKPVAAGLLPAAASTDIGTAYVDALGVSGAGWIALGLVGLWGANTAWRYRDVIAAKIARPIPRLATFLRSF